MTTKKELLERLLGETWVAIGVAPRTVGVVLPEALREKKAVEQSSSARRAILRIRDER